MVERTINLKREPECLPYRSCVAVERFFETFAFVKDFTDDGSLNSVSELEARLQELGWRLLSRGINTAVSQAGDQAWFSVVLNDVPLDIPRFTLRTMRHCLNFCRDGTILLQVETGHWERLLSRLDKGSLFVDIGSATGAMALPYAKLKGEDIQVVAFEPSARTRGVLNATVDRNGLSGNVSIYPFALSDQEGVAEFIELPLESGAEEIPWLPEGSRLSVDDRETIYPGEVKYQVEVRTLDALSTELSVSAYNNVVIKIDVEGFEVEVLRGGLGLISSIKPFLSIDIHTKPGGTVSTLEDVRSLLVDHGYEFEMIGHVLLCSHKN